MTRTDLPLVLVHGGGHGAWCWEPLLTHLSVPTLAVELPPKAVRGNPRAEAPAELAAIRLADFAASALADVAAAGFDRYVLVGHSLGGLTIAEVARQQPDAVAHLVFVSCIAPPEGAAVLDALGAELQERTRAALADQPVADAEPLLLDEATIRHMFCNDMDEQQTAFVLAHCGAEAGTPLTEPIHRQGLPPPLPKTYVRLARDQALSRDVQDAQIANLEASPGGRVAVVDLDAGHDVMISAPQLLAPVLERVAADAGAATPT